jgi:hypothetical protein
MAEVYFGIVMGPFPRAKDEPKSTNFGCCESGEYGGNEKSFTAVASGSGKNNGGGTDKGKAIIQDGFPEFEEHSKPNANSKSLTINMGNISFWA